jgi:ATP-dependent DNA helicase RecQ
MIESSFFIVIPIRMNQTLPAKAYQLLQKYWGYSTFRPLQEQAVKSVLDNEDSLIVLATGGGKSICYQLPALLMNGTAIVVSPLISLMKDQVDGLISNGIPAGFLNSSQSPQERWRIEQGVRDGEIKLLYIAPERLCMDSTMELLANCQVSFFAIDEAHCISHWGHDFRTDYRQLSQLKQRFPNIAVHGYTATATEQVREDIIEQLNLSVTESYVGSFDRPNLNYQVRSRSDLHQQIEGVIKKHTGDSGIIYCISRKKTEELADWLVSKGHKARCYHAGLTPEKRSKTQDDFQKQKIHIIVGTIAFGMGIDKSDVRYVIHTGAPKSLENYQQESGRAGRDGLPADCCLFYSAGDFVIWKKMQSDIPSENARDQSNHSLYLMEQYCIGMNCRHQALVEHFGQTYTEENCGACDVCLSQLELIPDSLVMAQKILSCVYRLREQFGATYTSQVLIGSKEKRIIELGHDQLSTYGLLKTYKQAVVRAWIEQLISQGCLYKDEQYQSLKLTARGGEVLKGQYQPRLLLPKQKAEKAKAAAKATTQLTPMEVQLFEELRTVRLELAQERSMAPYMVFHDTVLQQMARIRPHSLNSFAQLSGVGQKKLDVYGAAFVAAITEFCRKYQMSEKTEMLEQPVEQEEKPVPQLTQSPRAVKARGLYQLETSVGQVALQTECNTATAIKYLCEYIQDREITDVSPWVPEKVFKQIAESAEVVGMELMKPIKEHLHGKVSYDHIEIALAAIQVRKQNSATHATGK